MLSTEAEQVFVTLDNVKVISVNTQCQIKVTMTQGCDALENVLQLGQVHCTQPERCLQILSDVPSAIHAALSVCAMPNAVPDTKIKYQHTMS